MKKLLFLFLIPLMIACSTSPLDVKYDKEHKKEHLKAIKESGELETGDALLINGYIAKARLSGEDLEGKTYRDILEMAKGE